MEIPKRVALLACVATLAACGDSSRLAAPRVAVESVRLERVTVSEATFVVTLNLANPNTREIAVDAIDANVTIEDVPVGSATLRSPLRLPANGDATATLQARAGIAAVLRVGAEITQRAQEQRQNGGGQATLVKYAVAGTATLEGGLPIPFSRSGDFRIGGTALPAR